MKKLIFILFLILPAAIVFSQSSISSIKKIQSKYRAIEDFTADVTQYDFNAKGNVSSKVTGKFFYKRKNKFFVELGNYIIISDAKTVWNIDKRFNRVVISEANDEPSSFSVEKFIFEYPSTCKVRTIDDASLKSGEELLELVPNDDSGNFTLIKLWKNKDNFIYKIELVDVAGVKYFYEFSGIDINENLSDSKFTYIPSKGVKVIDLR